MQNELDEFKARVKSILDTGIYAVEDKIAEINKVLEIVYSRKDNNKS